MKEQPTYYFNVICDDQVIAKCHMPTPLIQEELVLAYQDNKKSAIWKAYKMIELLTEEWYFYDGDKPLPITIENIDMLQSKFQDALMVKISEKLNEWRENKEAISKN